MCPQTYLGRCVLFPRYYQKTSWVLKLVVPKVIAPGSKRASTTCQQIKSTMVQKFRQFRKHAIYLQKYFRTNEQYFHCSPSVGESYHLLLFHPNNQDVTV